ncbi:UDP-2,3-diacylglucosamine diphosphatase [Pseudoduganella sp. FT93W]|uniref:UDP-2,3-diacylglucosamine hydrolase n=1 Tax=Duganella fentianensis TaxID=2692177 RepID=A0A845HYB9_9BURK|nr:UDP-2,3-diacylglucosamine diphosphatase [Duganella fentianensis]MYN44737.1 UDP-2,3-diacylglucosamine diphosphatase [Duganella fentianensis]
MTTHNTRAGQTGALFISDLHLQAGQPATTAAFLRFLEQQARRTQQLYLLGDLFEYWAGDDDLHDDYHQQIIAALRTLSDAGVAIYWIAGNRDFLVGAEFAHAAGVTLLTEPHVATIAGQRVVLLHGDAQCTEDTQYMAFRAMVRQPAWQQQFLATPLAQRKAIIAGMRESSRKDQGNKSYEIMDVTPAAIAAVFAETACDVMIHGHTHRPALHVQDGKRRYVLPDWEPEATPARGGWIAIGLDGAITRHALDGTALVD